MPVRLQSRIDCICFAFLHCVSSNEPEKKHSHIDCICLAFLHYCTSVFSNASSNFMPVGIQSNLVTFIWLGDIVGRFLQIFYICICIITLVAFVWCFCTVYYKMSTQRSWIRAGKVALVAFVWLSSRVRFQMCPQMACPRTTDFQNFYVCGKNQTYVGIAKDYLNYHVCCFLPHMHGFPKYLRYVKVFPNTGWFLLYLFG